MCSFTDVKVWSLVAKFIGRLVTSPPIPSSNFLCSYSIIRLIFTAQTQVLQCIQQINLVRELKSARFRCNFVFTDSPAAIFTLHDSCTHALFYILAAAPRKLQSSDVTPNPPIRFAKPSPCGAGVYYTVAVVLNERARAHVCH